MTDKHIDISPLIGSDLKTTIEVPEDLTILESGGNVPKYYGIFRILHPAKGDERLIWDSRSLKEIQAAKKMFVDLIKQGLKPFRVGVNGKATSEAMSEFDPHAEEVIFLPTALVVGG